MKKCDNQLRQTLPRWTSETAITQGALNSKRDEFWETAPKYEGKKVVISFKLDRILTEDIDKSCS